MSVLLSEAQLVACDRNRVRANEVRVAHGRIKRGVKELGPVEGRRLVAGLLSDPTGYVLSMKVGQLLKSISWVGSVRVSGWLLSAGPFPISSDRRVGELSERQRLALADALVADRVERGVAA